MEAPGRRGYWLDQDTGEVWAVELTGDTVTRCCGPLPKTDASRELLDHWPYSARFADALHARRGRCLPFVPEG